MTPGIALARGRLPVALGLLALGCNPATPQGGVLDGVEVPLPYLDGVNQEVIDAIMEARKAVQQAPGSGDAWGNLGDRYLVQGFDEVAAPCYAKAAELDPGRYLWTYRLGWSHGDQHPKEAAAAFERSLHSLDDYAPAQEAYAMTLVVLGRSDEAIEHYARASQMDPASAHAETGLGLIYLARGDYQAAQLHLEQALARDGAHTEAHAGLAQVYLALGNEQEARRHAEISRTLPQMNPREDWMKLPNLAPVGIRRTAVGRQFQQQGKFAEAEEQYRLALRTNPNHYEARVRLARLLSKRGKSDEGRALLEEWLKLEPSSKEVRRDIARLFDSKADEE